MTMAQVFWILPPSILGHLNGSIWNAPMAHTIAGKKQLLTRVRRIKGQADALERALASETECMAVLQQIAAIRGAVNGLMSQVLEGHIREHLGASEVSEAQRGEDIDAVLGALRSYLK